MKFIRIIGPAALFLFVGSGAQVYAQHEEQASLKGNRSGRSHNHAHSLSNMLNHSNGPHRNSVLSSLSNMRSPSNGRNRYSARNNRSNIRRRSNGRNRYSALNSRCNGRSPSSNGLSPINPRSKATGPRSREATLLLSAAGNKHKPGSSRAVGGRTALGRSTQPGRKTARPTGRAITALGPSAAAMGATTSPKLVSASTLELGTCFASEANPA
jgi:hypothetical protein